MESERIEKIKHFSHEHPLVFIEIDQSDESKEACCSLCLESLLGRPSFGCGECEFYLHKKCAHAPSEISHSPFHRKHPTLTLSHSPFHRKHPTLTLKLTSIPCDFCMEKSDMFKYRCTSCDASFDIKCALLMHNMDEDFRELKYVGHEHPLTFFENLQDDLKRGNCHWCQKSVVDSMYVCLNCRFYLHKQCARLPTQLSHPCHRKHLLYSVDAKLVCSICLEEGWSLFYRCLLCKFQIDIKCARSKFRPVIECHEHSFTLFLRPNPFVCDACGTEGNLVSYICSTCHIMVHEKCKLVPRIIRLSQHFHNIVHKFFFAKERDLERHDCKICLSEVKVEYGNYMCSKKDCDFIVHVNCALGMNTYWVIDDAYEEGEEFIEYLATNFAIYGINEANKLKHFLHEHDLTLGNNIKEGDGKYCDACMMPILASFYHCSQCDILLHQTCAKLPKKSDLWFHRASAILYSQEIFQCNKCNRLCSGFVYKGDNISRDNFCLRCASTSRYLKCEGHEHYLFFDFQFEGKCSGCGFNCYEGAYRCKEDCNNTFALDFACITLPQATRYKCDKHLLKLTFHDEHDDPEQYYCDICEEKRDPNLWFYHCEICNNSVHPICVLGKYPFIKMKTGMAFPYDHHPHHHDLNVVKRSYDTCSWCGGPCTDVALGCTTCKGNYTIHYDCWQCSHHRAC